MRSLFPNPRERSPVMSMRHWRLQKTVQYLCSDHRNPE
ncbi:hypothetical protein [Azospirillum endophyticum]